LLVRSAVTICSALANVRGEADFRRQARARLLRGGVIRRKKIANEDGAAGPHLKTAKSRLDIAARLYQKSKSLGPRMDQAVAI